MRNVAIALALMIATAASAAEEVRLPAEGRTRLVITIYSSGFGYVEDVRPATLEKGNNRIAFEDVSPQMQPASALVQVGGQAQVRALDYDFNVIGADSLLKRFLGQTVDVVRTHPTNGEETLEPATVLAVDNGVVLRYRDRIETGAPGRLVFRELPPELRTRPTLVASIDSPQAGQVPLTLGYVTGGLDWSADYAVEVDEAKERLKLSARALIENRSGADFADAALALVAGEIKRAPEPMPMARKDQMAMAAAPAAPPSREELADLHLYTVAGTVSLRDRQTRQITLRSAQDVAFSRRYVSEGQVSAYGGGREEPVPSHPAVRYLFTNGASEPLPAGRVRLFARDTAGNLRPIGEEQIRHTPAGAKVTLEPSRAFDITVERRQTEYKQIGGKDSGIVELGWQIDVRNAKKQPVSVDLVEVMPSTWTILAESTPHERETGRRPVWNLAVGAESQAQLSYRVRLER